MTRKKAKIKILIGVVVIILVATSAYFSAGQTEASAAEKKPIVFGCVYGFRGAAAMVGKSARDGIAMAVEEINDAGGVLGRPLVCKVRDGDQDPETTLRESKDLVFKHDALWILCGNGTAVSMPVVDFAKESGKKENFLAIPMSAAAFVTQEKFNRYTFRLTGTSTVMTRVLAPIAYERWGANKVQSIGGDYSYARHSIKAFQEEYRKVNPKVEFTGGLFSPLGATDFTPYISKLMSSDAKLVYNSLWGGDYGAFLKQAFPYGFYDKFHEVSNVGGAVMSSGHLRRGDPYPKGALSGDWGPVWEVYGPLGKGFFERFHKKYGYYPTFHGASNYSQVHILASVVNDVASTDVEKLISGLEDRWVDHACGRFKIRGYDHQLLIPTWAGIVKFTERFPYPHTSELRTPENPESLYYTISEIKKRREKANNPYANYLGH